MELSVGNLIIGGGILATALGLLLEQIWSALAEWTAHRANRRRLRNFLKGWHAEALAYVT